jgi:hypothetical protein
MDTVYPPAIGARQITCILVRRVKLSHSRAATRKNNLKKFYASDQAELRPNPCRTRNQAGPWFTQMQILDQLVLELNPVNFHLFFLIFHRSKGCFLPDRQKVLNFTL